jgi:hypothetical protein
VSPTRHFSNVTHVRIFGMAAINVKGKKIPGSMTVVRDVRIGGDLFVEGAFNLASFAATTATFTTLTVGTMNVTTLNVTTFNVGTITATTGNFTTGNITTLVSTTGTFTNLTVTNNFTLGGVAINRHVWIPGAGTRSGIGNGQTAVTCAGTDGLSYGNTNAVAAASPNSFAFGQLNSVLATGGTNGECLAGGFNSTVNQRGSIAWGRNCTAVGISGASFGQACANSGNNSFSAGANNTIAAATTNCIALGISASITHTNCFVYGCGVNSTVSTGGSGSGNLDTISQGIGSFTASATGGAFWGLAGANFVVDGAVVASCDENLKEDISNFAGVALNVINGIQVRRYKRKMENQDPAFRNAWYKHEIAFLQSDLPTALKTGPNDEYVNTLSCIGLIFKALQETRAQLVQLRTDVNSLLP